jgi:gamma-glutamyl-gamma-aminobutyrate hydrolase PuuD
MKICIINGSRAYEQLFLSFGFALTNVVTEADALVFTGGKDVSPNLYGDSPHPYTHNSYHRDVYERKIFDDALEKQIPMIGICRGAQFLNVMSGGRMYQHVDEHTRSHHLVDLQTGETIYVTSTHHQMMLPQGHYLLVAASQLRGTREWFEGEIFKRDVSDQDNEAVFYPSTQCLCFQPHPEMGQGEAEYEGMRKYFRSLIQRFFNV